MAKGEGRIKVINKELQQAISNKQLSAYVKNTKQYKRINEAYLNATKVISGGYKYRIKRQKVYLPNLPESFLNIKIAHISDIHAGNLVNKKAVEIGVDLLMNENPDIVFFTGDLVTYRTSEANEIKSILAKIQAPYGVFAVLGNHDYGDYAEWENPKAKEDNLNSIKEFFHEIGWKLLLNECEIIEKNEEKIAIIGVENWSKKRRFPKYGNLNKAVKGSKNIPVKLLLSHDPSHWESLVLPHHKDVAITFSGHTHGFQFGLGIKDWKWSPAQYFLKHWRGMYQSGNQYLYVNTGFGFIGMPGRIGMPPEITIMTLKKRKKENHFDFLADNVMASNNP
ncbi:MAG: metallophosphoesterase [Bacteroidetes bacterium]|nr:metallophosphoesterase [Bacteroidota bacterium]